MKALEDGESMLIVSSLFHINSLMFVKKFHIYLCSDFIQLFKYRIYPVTSYQNPPCSWGFLQ